MHLGREEVDLRCHQPTFVLLDIRRPPGLGPDQHNPLLPPDRKVEPENASGGPTRAEFFVATNGRPLRLCTSAL